MVNTCIAVKKVRASAVTTITTILDNGDIRCTFFRGKVPNFGDLLFLRFHFMQNLDLPEVIKNLKEVETICEMLSFAAPVAWRLRPQLLSEVDAKGRAFIFASVPIPREHLRLIKTFASETKEPT